MWKSVSALAEGPASTTTKAGTDEQKSDVFRTASSLVKPGQGTFRTAVPLLTEQASALFHCFLLIF